MTSGINNREFVNDPDTKELLAAIEQYARGRGVDWRVVVFYDVNEGARVSTVDEARRRVDDREFVIEASHWYEVKP